MAKEPLSPVVPTAGGYPAMAGLVIRNNETIRAFLLFAAAEEQTISSELRDLASDLSSQSAIPYRALRSVWSALPVGARPSIFGLFSDADFILYSPKPREKSKELKERLRKLAEMAERKEYEELVKDVAPSREKVEPFSSYKDQIGFGLHVVVVMFTGYLVGFASFRALFNHSAAMVNLELLNLLHLNHEFVFQSCNCKGGIILICRMLVVAYWDWYVVCYLKQFSLSLELPVRMCYPLLQI